MDEHKVWTTEMFIKKFVKVKKKKIGTNPTLQKKAIS